MKIGIPKEIKKRENRVAITPATTKVLVDAGNEVFIEKSAGVGSSFPDKSYEEAGAKMVSVEEAWDQEMVMKVKEPLESEYKYLKEDLILFTYLHLANEPELTKVLIDNNVTAIAYETMEKDGGLPLLAPMSQVAGRYATQVGASLLTQIQGGKGILLGSVPGVRHGSVVIIGGGQVGEHAARMALGLGARVTILDLNPTRLEELDEIFNGHIDTLMSNSVNIANSVKDADLVISGVLIPGRKAPILITEEMVKSMEEGSVIVDIAIDQGGNVETSTRATTHDDPTFVKHGVIHYTVANVPGAVPQTSTSALTNVTAMYAQQIASKGPELAAKENPTIATGFNAYKGKITNVGVAETFDYQYSPINELF